MIYSNSACLRFISVPLICFTEMLGSSSLPLNKLRSSSLRMIALLFWYLVWILLLLLRYFSSLLFGFYLYLSTLSTYLSVSLLYFFFSDDLINLFKFI